MENMESINNKKSNVGIIITGVIAAIAIGVFAFSGDSKQDKMMMAEKEAMEQKAMIEKEVMIKAEAMKRESNTMKDNVVMKKDAMKGGSMMVKDTMMTSGSYELYSSEKLAWAKDGKVVLFFKAVWCPTCKAVDADIKAHLSAIPKGTYILEVDYDKSAELKKKYGVTYQHTFVQVDSSGMQLAKWSGSQTLTAILPNIK